MQTRVCRLYGANDLRIETEEVAAPGAGEVLVAVAAGGICGSDMHYLSDGGIGTTCPMVESAPSASANRSS